MHSLMMELYLRRGGEYIIGLLTGLEWTVLGQKNFVGTQVIHPLPNLFRTIPIMESHYPLFKSSMGLML
jgi:hypothetical protein